MTPWRRARQNDGSRSSTSGVDSTSTSSGAASSGAQGTSSSSIACSRSPRTVAVVLSAAVQLHVEQRAEEGPERVVRRRRLVLLAAQRDLPHVGAVLPQLLRRDATFRSRARRRARRAFRSPSAPARPTRRALHAPARDRRTAAPPPPASPCSRPLGAAELAEDERLDRLALPLERERLELRRLEASAPPRASASCGDPDLVLAGARHQARRERRRVAEHRVRPPEARADLAREHAALAHSDRGPEAGGRRPRPRARSGASAPRRRRMSEARPRRG